MDVSNGFSSIDGVPRCSMDTFSSTSPSIGASHSNCSSFTRMRELYLTIPRRHGKGGIFLHRRNLHRRVFPKRYMISPNKITARPAISESFSGVAPGKNGNANTKLPMGTMTVDAMTSTFADPNLTSGTIHEQNEDNQ